MVGDTSNGSISVDELVRFLSTGEVVGFPTDTVYGMGCLMREGCVEKLKRLKGKREKPFAIFIHSMELLKDYVEDIPDYVLPLLNKKWPGGLTVVFKAKEGVPRDVVSKDGKIGIRIPDYPLLLEAMKVLSTPIVNTSANPAGAPPPFSHKDVALPLKYLLKGSCTGKVPSTVVDVTGKDPVILRKGAVKVFEMESLTGRVFKLVKGNILNILFVCSGNTCRSPMAQYHLSYCARDVPLFIRSAGLMGITGFPATPEAISVMKEIGVDLTSHRSVPLSEELVLWADLILPMEPAHKEEILRMGANPYTVLPFYEIIDESKVPDPIGKDIGFYREVRDMIVKGNRWLKEHFRKRFIH